MLHKPQGFLENAAWDGEKTWIRIGVTLPLVLRGKGATFEKVGRMWGEAGRVQICSAGAGHLELHICHLGNEDMASPQLEAIKEGESACGHSVPLQEICVSWGK